MDTKRTRTKLFRGLVGSRAYGTFNEHSDWDWREIHTLSISDHLDPFFNEEQIENIKDGEDFVSYELRKFIKLASQSNPNILELLFLPLECIEFVHPLFQKHILGHRQEFLSKEAYKRFMGYAFSQLSRLKKRQNDFRDPPTGPPDREEYRIPMYLTNEQVGQIACMPVEACSPVVNGSIPIDQVELLAISTKQKARYQDFLNKKKRWDNYKRWLNERNPERAEMERRFGYDLKHAISLVRLAFECEDIFTDNTIHIPSKKVDVLRDIKAGKWTQQQLLDFADEYEEKLKVMCEESSLPERVDVKKVTGWYQALLGEV